MSFNPRAPVGSDHPRKAAALASACFQSTGPCGAHSDFNDNLKGEGFQSTGPCGARPRSTTWSMSDGVFQSTGPCGARPSAGDFDPHPDTFNPRAPVGPDSCVPVPSIPDSAFNPRAPVGPNRQGIRPTGILVFQSTGPCGARPSIGCSGAYPATLSIHGPLWGPTEYFSALIALDNFQSTGPCGARLTTPLAMLTTVSTFNPRAPVGPDYVFQNFPCQKGTFNPRAPVGPTNTTCSTMATTAFQSTGPSGARPRE